MSNPKDVKTFCYKPKSECKIVRAGFHLTQFWSCSTCKYEVSEALKESREEKDELNDFGLWGINLDGDDSY